MSDQTFPTPPTGPLVYRAVAAMPLAGKPYYEVLLETMEGNPVVSRQMTLLFHKTEAQRLLELLQANPPIPGAPSNAASR